MAMKRNNARAPICCFPSGRRPGRTCWSARCLPSNCSARRRSLRTTPIIAKDRRMRGAAFALLLCPLLAASALAQSLGQPLDLQLKEAQAEQATAEAQTDRLEKAASRARSEAERLHAEQAAA